MNRLVCGVGRNDADYPVYVRSVICGKRKIMWTCPFYRAWKDMLNRCYGAREHERRPTYIGCTVAPAWLTFSAFRAWMLAQEWEGRQLDKDILSHGNKVYSPESCVFVPRQLNAFMTDSRASRGEWPIGVSWQKDAGKFTAKCCNPFSGNHDYLGLFTCPSAAHEAWRKRKHELACQYADQQTDPRIAQALRTRYANRKEAAQ